MTEELKPCPFCGAEAEFKPYKQDGLTLKCKSPGCVVFNQRALRYSLDWLRDKMIESWNARATSAPAQPEITWATCQPWETLTASEKAASLIEELEATAERITRYSNSPLDGLMHAAADVLRELTAAPAQPEGAQEDEPVAWRVGFDLFADKYDADWEGSRTRTEVEPLYLRPSRAAAPAEAAVLRALLAEVIDDDDEAAHTLGTDLLSRIKTAIAAPKEKP